MENNFNKMLFAVCLSNFTSSIALSQIMPLLPFIMAKYNVSEEHISLYSGLAYGGSTIVMAICAPFWGMLADKVGQKKMLLRASFGMATCLLISIFITSGEGFIILRLFMGLFSGFMSSCVAIVAINSPKDLVNTSLAKLSSFQIGGTLVGPLIGGVLMHFFDFRVQFLLSSVLLFVCFFMCLFWVKENFTPSKNKPKTKINKGFYGFVLMMGVATFLVQSSQTFLGPVIGFFIAKISDYQELGTGFCFSLAGLASVIFAPKLSKYASKIGEINLILISTFCMSVCLALHYVSVDNYWFFCVIRFLTGISFCPIMPSVYSLIKKNTPADIGSRVFGINQSFFGIGSFVGSVSGGYLYGIFDSGIFLICALFVFFNFLLFGAYKFYSQQTS